MPAGESLGAWAKKRIDVADAIARIRPGRRIFVGSGAAEPEALVQGLCDYGEHLEQNEIVHLLTLGAAPYVAPALAHRFRHAAFFIGANVRQAVQEGRADFIPVFLSEIPALIRSGRMPIDVALIQVSPPDRHGFVSLGVSVDIVRAAVENASFVVAEVNPHMPRTFGESVLSMDLIDAVVPVDHALPELLAPVLDDADREIGKLVATLIPDGATLQLGIGRAPDATLEALSKHRDLGIHTEMFSDGVRKLVESGVITGKRKNTLPGKLVTSFVMGSPALYDWVDENPSIEMRGSDFTNDPFVIAQHERFVSINSALAVDLTGQVAADSIGTKLYSGIGGQVDFVRGASRSRGGRSIIAMRATAEKGARSRISAELEAGSGVVTTRGDVHYVVTEYGIADLWGKSIRQRAMALIDIAHPDVRADLLARAKDRKYVFGDERSPRRATRIDPKVETLKDGEQVVVRSVRASDEGMLTDFFYRLGDQSTYMRFFHPKKYFPHSEMADMVQVDGERNVALLATTEDDALLAVVHYALDEATQLAEVAFVVREDHHRHGIASLLLKRLIELGKARGIRGLCADVLEANHTMMALFEHSGLTIDGSCREGVHHLVMTW
jgi:acyl-CoA hydrolase/GNAT superfamily N-acetyltransferase